MDENTENLYNNIIWGNNNNDDIVIYGAGTVNSYTNSFVTAVGSSLSIEDGNMNADPQVK